MLKETLLKCAKLLDRDDLVETIKDTDSVITIENKQQQMDVIKLISYYNYITNLICENYIDLIRIDTFVSDSSRKIFYDSFLFRPIKILSAKSAESPEYFHIFADHILVKNANKKYEIEYKFAPCEVNDFCDEECARLVISEDIMALGIVSQFLASKGKYNESEYLNDKFMYRLFKLKCNKERRLKPHFVI